MSFVNWVFEGNDAKTAVTGPVFIHFVCSGLCAIAVYTEIQFIDGNTMKSGIKRSLLIAIILAGTLPAATAVARDYYRWVDDNGVVHFSEDAPAGEVEQLQKIKLDDPPLTQPSRDDPFNIEATQERTQAYREDLNERRARARENRMELERIAAQQKVVHYHQQGSYVPAWYTRPLRPRPPAARPPERPRPEPYESVPYRPPGGATKR